jgi:AcrR family transcriptional regulator
VAASERKRPAPSPARPRASRPDRPAHGERYDRRQADVVEASAAVFAEHGYERTSVAELAEQLGLATGALYHYFPGKEQLLIRICDQLMSPLLAASEEVLAAASAPEKQLREPVRLWVAHVTRHRDHLLVFQQVRHLVDHGEQWKEIRADRKHFERLLAGALERALGAGRLAERDLALYALLGMVNHTVQWFRPRGPLSPEQIADGYVDLVLGGGPGA